MMRSGAGRVFGQREELARLRLASFDHISSYPAVVLPVADLARLVKERTGGRALVLVDGAHGLGQAPDCERAGDASADNPNPAAARLFLGWRRHCSTDSAQKQDDR